MKAAICYSSVTLASLTIGVATALTPIGNPSFTTLKTSALSALSNSSSGPWGSRGVPSKTARESAFNVEWEPMTELERRIEDGVHYEHMQSRANRRHQQSKHSETSQEDGIPTSRGVFVGNRVTKEEYARLKSADPSQ